MSAIKPSVGRQASQWLPSERAIVKRVCPWQRYEIELQPMPAFADLSSEEYRAMIAEVLSEIEEEAAAKRGDRPVLGVEKILSEDPCRRSRKTKKSPAPMLFFAARKETREAQANSYKDFVDEFELAADRLIEAALQGRRLGPSRHFPTGSFPPSLIGRAFESRTWIQPRGSVPEGELSETLAFRGRRTSTSAYLAAHPPAGLQGSRRPDNRVARRDPDGSRSLLGPSWGWNRDSRRGCPEPGT